MTTSFHKKNNMAKYNIGDIVDFQRNIFIFKNSAEIVYVFPITDKTTNINISLPAILTCVQTYIIEYEGGWSPVGKYDLDETKKYLFVTEDELTP